MTVCGQQGAGEGTALPGEFDTVLILQERHGPYPRSEGNDDVSSLTRLFRQSGQHSRGKAMTLRMRSRSHHNRPQHEPGLTPLNSEPRTSPAAYLLNSGSWDR
jgi:hypothetical protein